MYRYCTIETKVHLHQAIWFRCVCLIVAIESVISVVIGGIFQVLFKAHLDITGVSQASQIVEEVEVVLVEMVGVFQKLDHREMKPCRSDIATRVIAVMIPPCRSRHVFHSPAACCPAMFNDGVV